MKFSWLSFSKTLLLSSPRPPGDCVRSIDALIVRPWSNQPGERRRPFLGRIDGAGGVIRCRFITLAGPISCRALTFELYGTPSGTELRGRWRLLKRVQIPVFIYFILCAAAEIQGLVRIGLHRSHSPLMALMGPLIGFAMIYGWTWVFILLSRKPEAQLESAVFHAMASEESAKVAAEVLYGLR